MRRSEVLPAAVLERGRPALLRGQAVAAFGLDLADDRELAPLLDSLRAPVVLKERIEPFRAHRREELEVPAVVQREVLESPTLRARQSRVHRDRVEVDHEGDFARLRELVDRRPEPVGDVHAARHSAALREEDSLLDAREGEGANETEGERAGGGDVAQVDSDDVPADLRRGRARGYMRTSVDRVGGDDEVVVAPVHDPHVVSEADRMPAVEDAEEGLHRLALADVLEGGHAAGMRALRFNRCPHVMTRGTGVRRPGFEPGQMAWQAIILTRLYYRRAAAPRARGGIKNAPAAGARKAIASSFVTGGHSYGGGQTRSSPGTPPNTRSWETNSLSPASNAAPA